MTPSRPHSWLRRAPLIAILVVAALGAFVFRDFLSYETIRDNREMLITFRDQNYVASVILFIVLYAAIVAFSLPGATVASLTGGFLFATFPGLFFNLIAATLGATGIFLAVRAGFGDRLAARMETSDGAIKRFKDGVDQNQWSALFLIRLVPAVPFFVANVLPALFQIPLSRFLIATFLGIIPGTLVLTSIGAGLGEVFDAGQVPDLSLLVSPAFLLPVLGLCLLAALPLVARRWTSRKGT
jgi:uncharacterized membrane protein YdjX (TVP38/TMEM64 family)